MQDEIINVLRPSCSHDIFALDLKIKIKKKRIHGICQKKENKIPYIVCHLVCTCGKSFYSISEVCSSSFTDQLFVCHFTAVAI